MSPVRVSACLRAAPARYFLGSVATAICVCFLAPPPPRHELRASTVGLSMGPLDGATHRLLAACERRLVGQPVLTMASHCLYFSAMLLQLEKERV